MTNVVLLGGNGYIGRNVTEEWLRRDTEAVCYVVSRSGKTVLSHSRVHQLRADVRDARAVLAVLPDRVDYIVDFIGRPESDPKTFQAMNDEPAQVMLAVAQKKQVKAMGFIGGLLGPKSFVAGKKRIANQLRASGIRTEVVEPTVVYGSGRKDALAKLIPLFKIFGLFIRNMKPVLVTDVAQQLVSQMVEDNDS